MNKPVIILKRIYIWLFKTKLPLLSKLVYMAEFCFVILTNKRNIIYLGNKFRYDNKIVPFSLMYYPFEIQETILDYVGDDVESVLDIGGNVGQFSITLNYYKNLKIDVLEPNKEIFELLKINTTKFENIKIYNKGVGKPQKTKLYFSEGRSATGSLEKANASNDKKDKIVETEIELISNIQSLTGTESYDLIKIDVEGCEYDVLENIKILKPKYLLIEISTDSREHSRATSELYKLITNKFGRFEILYSDAVNNKIAGYNQLLKFE